MNNKTTILDNQSLDYSIITKDFINSIIIRAKEYIKNDFKYPICWFLNGKFEISNAVILDYSPSVRFKFLRILKKELKQQKAVAYIIIKKITISDTILRTKEENMALPKTINNNYTLNNHIKYDLIIKDALVLSFASKLEKMKITIPYTKDYKKVTMENFREETAKGGIIFNLLS